MDIKEKIVPFFVVDGKTYEIKRTRYLLAEYQKLQEKVNISKDDKENAVLAQNIVSDMQRYAQMADKCWETFCQTADDEDERKYLKFKGLYDEAFAKLAKLEVETGSTNKVQKASIDLLERIVILGIAEQYHYTQEQAQDIWCSYVDSIGKDKAVEWLTAMAECLFVAEEDEDGDFLSQMRKRREIKAQARKSKK